jgi:Gram-negative bacterial TonB protein C-terminal
MTSINSVHSSGIFDSNDSTSAAPNSSASAPSRSANANVATRPVSNAYVATSDVPQDHDIQIPAPKGFSASWVEVPGEHLVRSAAGTVHIRRMVRVPGERIPGQRWLWKGKLDITLGDVVNRIDPAVVQASGASGSLTVMASIDKDGYVTDLKPLNGNFALLPAVSRTVRNWHYDPTYLDNKRAETQAQIEFDLRPAPVSASNRSNHP